MWNTDPVIVVGVLVCLWGLTAAGAVIVIEALKRQYTWALGGWKRANELHDETKAQLREAQRNDHRDTKGRYASAVEEWKARTEPEVQATRDAYFMEYIERPCKHCGVPVGHLHKDDCEHLKALREICIPPGNYPANR